MALPYGPPYPVSPLIRGLRYAFLITGIIYGLAKQKIYEIQEANWREEAAKKKVIRDREMAAIRARIAIEERETVKLLESGKLFETEELSPDKPEDKSAKGQTPKSKSTKKCKNCGECTECKCK